MEQSDDEGSARRGGGGGSCDVKVTGLTPRREERVCTTCSLQINKVSIRLIVLCAAFHSVVIKYLKYLFVEKIQTKTQTKLLLMFRFR